MAMTRRLRVRAPLFLTILVPVLLAAATADAAPPVMGADSGAVLTTERVAVHVQSGFANDGYDVVAYFAEGRARPGSAEHEVLWNGVAWRFSSAANRAAFLRDPQVYAPRFGGYDAEGASRGIAIAADPRHFRIMGGQLYLFRSAEAARHLLDAPAALWLAETGWHGALRTLSAR